MGGSFGVAIGAVAVASPAAATPSVVPVSGTNQLLGIACTTPTTCLAVGINRFVLIHRGVEGGAVSLPTGVQLDAVACPTTADCYAVGTWNLRGAVVPFVYGEALTPVVVPGTTTLESIACAPSTTSCVAVGEGYTPGPPASIYGAVVALTAGAPSAPVQQVLPINRLHSVSCPTASACLAVGQGSGAGAFVSIASGVAGTPVLPAGVGPMTTVACASATVCWAGTGSDTVVPIAAGVAGTPVAVAGTSGFHGSTCPTPTQCYLSGSMSSPGGFVVPVTAGVVGTPQVDISGSGIVYSIACVRPDACLAAGDEFVGRILEGVIVTSAAPTPPPTVSSVTLSGSGYGLTVTVKGTNFQPWPPEASPIAPVPCAPGHPSYDYAAGVLSFADTSEGWSAGSPGSCIGVVIQSWSTTQVRFGLGAGYVWPLVANGDAYQVTVLGLTTTGTAAVTATAAPRITTVLVTGTGGTAPPTVTVKGTALGSRVPLAGPSPTCVTGDTSRVYPNNLVFVSDSSHGWTAGEPGDCLGLTVSSWTPTKVVLTFGPFYADVGALSLGDSLTVGLLDATWSGSATATLPPTISGLTVTGTAASPVVTVSGKGFGTRPSPVPSTPISCVPGDTSYTYPAGVLQFTDTNGAWTAGETGDCIGLAITTWSSTKVVLTFGADYPNFRPVTAGDSVTVMVKGTSHTATAKV